MLVISFSLFGREESGKPDSLFSVIGVISLVFGAEGNPIGQFLMILFSIFLFCIEILSLGESDTGCNFRHNRFPRCTFVPGCRNFQMPL